MIAPLFNAQDDEWVVMVGRYILNMGAIELATRLIIARIAGTDQVPIFSSDLAARLGYIRKRFPRADQALHERAMNTLNVAVRHTGFRNIVAHSPIAISGHADGTFKIQGIMNVTPKSSKTLAELVTLDELKGRVNESAAVAREVLEMQSAFPVNAGRIKCQQPLHSSASLNAGVKTAARMQPDKPTLLVEMARTIAAENPTFQEVLGPGAGDHRTSAFMKRLRDTAEKVFGADYSERKICGETSLAVDFYFPQERTIVEIALGLPNPSTEFEKDVLKAIMAQETGQSVTKLVLVSRAGGVRKCDQPGRAAVKAWAKSKHGLEIEIHDLPGQPRKRKREKPSRGVENRGR